jgi:hypothetical protein
MGCTKYSSWNNVERFKHDPKGKPHNNLLTYYSSTVIQPYIKPYYNINMKDMEQQHYSFE